MQIFTVVIRRHDIRLAQTNSTVGLDGVRADIAMMRTPDGHGRVELTRFHTPAGGQGRAGERAGERAGHPPHHVRCRRRRTSSPGCARRCRARRRDRAVRGQLPALLRAWPRGLHRRTGPPGGESSSTVASRPKRWRGARRLERIGRMGVHRILSSDVRAQFPAGTVLHNPVSGEYARVVEHTPERVVSELLAVPGAAVAGPHSHPGQEERFEVLDGVMGYRRDTDRGELRAGGSVTVAPGVVHDWWNAGESDLRARVTVIAPGAVRRHDRCGLGSGGGWTDEREGNARTRRRGAAGRSVRRRDRLRTPAPSCSAGACPHSRANRSSARSVGDPRGDARGDPPV